MLLEGIESKALCICPNLTQGGKYHLYFCYPSTNGRGYNLLPNDGSWKGKAQAEEEDAIVETGSCGWSWRRGNDVSAMTWVEHLTVPSEEWAGATQNFQRLMATASLECMYELGALCALFRSSQQLYSIPFYRWGNWGSLWRLYPWDETQGARFLGTSEFRWGPSKPNTVPNVGMEMVSHLQGPVTVHEGLLILPEFYISLKWHK